MSRPIYTAIFLTPESKQRLLELFPPQHESVHAHHVTLKFKPTDADIAVIPMGKTVSFSVIGHASNNDCQAIAVKLPPDVISNNSIPHITISTAPGIAPKASNSLLANGFENTKHVTLEGVVGVFPHQIGESVIRTYVSHVINEGKVGKYNSFISDIVKQATDYLKTLKAPGVAKKSWYVSWPFSDEYSGETIRIILERILEFGDETDLSVGGEFGSTRDGTPYIKIEIDAVTNRGTRGNPDITPLLSHIVKNMYSTVTHELEHALQQIFVQPGANRPIGNLNQDDDDEDNTYSYLVDPSEISAHVKGLYALAKKTRQPLHKVIKHLLNQYQETGALTRQEASTVYAKWRTWAKKNLPAADIGAGSDALFKRETV